MHAYLIIDTCLLFLISYSQLNFTQTEYGGFFPIGHSMHFQPEITTLPPQEYIDQRIALATTESIYLIKISDIIRCKSSNNYTEFFLQNQKAVLVSRTLKEYEKLLCAYGFIRVHQSHLINIKHLNRYDKQDGGLVIMSDQSTLPVSVRSKEQLIQLLRSYCGFPH